MDLESAEKNNSLLEKAARQLEEDEDEIKRMNELILHAKCMTIREAQIAEKKLIQAAESEEATRLDAIMEAERLRDIERQHEREAKRKQEMRDGAVIIRKQIEDRREAVILEAERKDREIKANLKQLQEQNEKEIQNKILKMQHQKEHLKEIQKANAESIDRRKNAKIQAREEDRIIMEYLLSKVGSSRCAGGCWNLINPRIVPRTSETTPRSKRRPTKRRSWDVSVPCNSG